MVGEQADAPLLTLEQYRVLERSSPDAKHEYLDGHLVLMAGGTRRHAALCGTALTLLVEAVGDGPCHVYPSDMRVRLSETRQVYPDVSVTCDERDRENDEDDEIAYPRLVVEVLSPSTERVDRGRKLRDYQACASVAEYVLVNGDYQAVEVYRRGDGGWTYHRYESGSDVEFASLGVRRPVAAFYRRTDVPVTMPG